MRVLICFISVGSACALFSVIVAVRVCMWWVKVAVVCDWCRQCVYLIGADVYLCDWGRQCVHVIGADSACHWIWECVYVCRWCRYCMCVVGIDSACVR